MNRMAEDQAYDPFSPWAERAGSTSRGACPHCRHAAFFRWSHVALPTAANARSAQEPKLGLKFALCPACMGLIVDLVDLADTYSEIGSVRIYPGPARPPSLDPLIPQAFQQEYGEAASALVISPNASAALSRRCLQRLIRERAGITKRNLADEIQALLDQEDLPPSVADLIDAIRVIGNLAAHPTEAAGEIFDVTEAEATFLLEILEGLLRHFFVAPVQKEERLKAINERIASAGKALQTRPPTGEEGNDRGTSR